MDPIPTVTDPAELTRYFWPHDKQWPRQYACECGWPKDKCNGTTEPYCTREKLNKDVAAGKANI